MWGENYSGNSPNQIVSQVSTVLSYLHKWILSLHSTAFGLHHCRQTYKKEFRLNYYGLVDIKWMRCIFNKCNEKMRTK